MTRSWVMETVDQRSDEPLEQRVVKFKAYGFLVFLYMFTLEQAPYPISPHLLLLLIDGHAAFGSDPEYLKRVHPSLADQLAPWVQWYHQNPQRNLQDLKKASSSGLTPANILSHYNISVRPTSQ